MRVPAPWLLLLLPAVAAPAAAHDPAGHVNPIFLDLEPGAVEHVELVWPEDPSGEGLFQAGWVFLIHGHVVEGPGPVMLELWHEDQVVTAFQYLAGEDPRTYTARMPRDGAYELRARTLGNETTRVGFFYDQSCECAGKPIPVEIPNGLIVFNVDVEEGTSWRATIPEPAAHELSIWVAWRTNDRSRWPEDYEVLASSPEGTPDETGRDVHVLEWEADHAGRYYFFVKAVETHPDRVDRSNPTAFISSVMVTPTYEELETERGTPLGLWTILALLPAAAAIGRRR